MQNQILKVLVGSRAHGLHTEESDYDWRGVFVTPTQDILKLGGTTTQTSWIEGKEDDTSWEIGKFLFMATKCNPTVLEVFKAPIQGIMVTEDVVGGVSKNAVAWGLELQKLFPYVWNSRAVMDAFVGYGLNQRKKFLENKDVRPHKYAVAYLRTLYLAEQLLLTGDFQINMADTPIFDTLLRWKNKDYQVGEVIQITHEWEKKVRSAFERNPDKKTEIEPINKYLLEIRKEFWT
jgi:uncharacterized protein